MKNLLSILGVLLFVVMTVSCTSTSTVVQQVGCALEGAVVNTVTVAIANDLQCTNQSAIAATITASAAKVGICASPAALAIGKPKPVTVPLKSVGSDLCGSLLNSLTGNLANNLIPAGWGCSAAAATTQLSGLVTTACAKAFP